MRTCEQGPKVGILLIFILSFFWFVSPKIVFSDDFHPGAGASADDLKNKLEENRKEQERVRKLLEETRSKKVTLQNEIAYQDTQIHLTTLKIEETESEIEALSQQIDRLEVVLTDLSMVFAERAVETYKLKRLGDSFVILLTANSVSEFISRFNYLQRLQQNDRELLLQMQASQTTYEDRRTQVEALHDKLEEQKAALASLKRQKENLLSVTKNDEKKFQELLKTLQADEQSIKQALASIFQNIIAGITTGTGVKKGDPIGIEGNTGNSTGPHLHFMYLTCSAFSCVSDPSSVLNNGEYRLPMDFPNGNWQAYETQGYGCTDFASRYTSWYGGQCFHNGRDLSLKGGNPIYAVADGTVYYGVDRAGGKYALIKHKDDFWTAYWHLQ